MAEPYKQQIECALATVRVAGDLLRRAFRDGYSGDLDKAAELLIRDVLLRAFPKYGYRGEETGFVSPSDDAMHLWLVDPLDGTSAAKKGFRGAAVSIALLRNGLPVLGVVYAYAAPDHTGDLFWWSEGLRGIVRNGNHIIRDWPANASPSGTVLISQAADEAPGVNLELVAPMRYRGIPGIAYRLALVAAGDGDVGISLNGPVSWDFAGGHALLLGAGGDLFDQRGNAVTYGSDGSVRNSPSSACFGGQHALVDPLIHRDWTKPFNKPKIDSAANKLCYLKPKEVVADEGVLSRAQGCILGQLAGDALGSLVEFQPAETIRTKYPGGPRLLLDGGTFHTLAGQPTDDSELALSLARSIIESNGYNEEAVARAYARWYASRPFDIGNTTRSALAPAWRAIEQGLAAAAAAKAAASATSQANGALMRISPLGIFGAALPLDVIFGYARADATLTHPHPICLDASAVFATTIAFAIQRGGSAVDTYEFATGIATDRDVAVPVLKALQDAAANEPRDYYSQKGWVLIALQNAFYQLLHAGFEEGVVNSVRSGGDTDTNGAIAGALLGAVYGRAAVPQQWLDRILTCRPIAGFQGINQPRPAEFWPVDALCLAERLLLAGQYAGSNVGEGNRMAENLPDLSLVRPGQPEMALELAPTNEPPQSRVMTGDEPVSIEPELKTTVGAPTQKEKQMQAKVPKTKIIEALVSILSNEPQGLRTGELLKRIRDCIPGLVHCHRVVLDYAEGTDALVYKPIRGLFRHVKYRSQVQQEEPCVQSPSEKIAEEKFYKPFAEWLELMEECTEAICVGGAKFKTKWGTPDVVGVRKPRPGDVIKNSVEVVSGEVKVSTAGLITAFGQACAYKLFSHKSYIVVPKNADREDIDRLDSLCLIFGIGFVLFDSTSAENADFQIRVRAARHEPDMDYVNDSIKLIAKELHLY